MIAIKRFSIISIFLLSACAPKPPANELEMSPNLSSPAAGTPAKVESLNSNQKTNSAAKQLTAHGKLQTEQDTITSAEEKIAQDSKITKGKILNSNTSGAAKISSWEISGAMAARSKNKGWSASLNWLQRGPSQYQMRLSGPLGGGTVIISRNGGVVTLRDGPKTVSSSNASSLVKQQTGISLPVNNLYYWVRGIPAPGAIQGEKRDKAGRLVLLRQGGYTIAYQQYTSAGKAVLPSHIRLQGNGVFIKLVIRNWKV